MFDDKDQISEKVLDPDGEIILEQAWDLAEDALKSLAPDILDSEDEEAVYAYNVLMEYIELKRKDIPSPEAVEIVLEKTE